MEVNLNEGKAYQNFAEDLLHLYVHNLRMHPRDNHDVCRACKVCNYLYEKHRKVLENVSSALEREGY